MALRSGYKGIKKLAAGLKWNRPGILAADDTALAKVFFPRSEQAVLGAKNICPMPYSSGYTHETNGITFTVNADGSYVANGTATNSAFLEFFRDYNTILEKDKKYIASSGQTANGGTQVYYRESYQSGDWVLLAATVTEEVEFTVPNNANIILIRGYIGSGNTVSNKTYYPMIRLASDPDNTYVPYAMTNKELTDAVQGIINAATNAADFAAFKTAIGNL